MQLPHLESNLAAILNRPRRSSVVVLTMLAGLSGCADSSTELVCTMEFRILTIQVHDSNGLPVSDATLTVYHEGTNSAWPPATGDGGFSSDRGTYAVIDDSHLQRIERGENVPLTLSATRSAQPAAVGTASWVVTSDGCHVSRVSGPDTLTITGVDP